MKKSAIIVALALGVSAFTLMAQDQGGLPPADDRPPGNQAGPGGQHGPGGFHLLPPQAKEVLNLTADQQAQVTALEAETKAKLEKILTPEQMAKLKQMRPGPRPGGRSNHGPGGSGGSSGDQGASGGGPGGPGGDQGGPAGGQPPQ